MKCNIPKDCPSYIPLLPVRTLQCNLYPVTTRQNSPMQPISCYYPLELSNAQMFVNNFLKSCCRLPKCYIHIDTAQSIDSVQQNEHCLLLGERKNITTIPCAEGQWILQHTGHNRFPLAQLPSLCSCQYLLNMIQTFKAEQKHFGDSTHNCLKLWS
jgi:hypothetical protein